MLLSQPIRIVHLMIWNEMTDSELIAILEKVNQELYHDYREKMRSLEKNENNRRNEILSGGKKKLQTGKGRKTVGRTDEMVPGCKVWHVYSLGSIFDARKREWVLMNEHLDVRKYETLKDDFLAENFDAEQWAKNAKAAGMKYMVLTTRHHDGFCLFDSKCSDFTAMKGAAHRDFVKEYVEACRKEGMKVGFYYSPLDWRFQDISCRIFTGRVQRH